MIAILINCITLGSYQPCHDAHCETKTCQWIKISDHLLFIFFLCEMLIKMIAMGVHGAPNTYLADYWNRLDCFIVIAGALEYILDTGNVNLAAIRTVRVLRPLRAINRIPSMRILVTLLLDTLPMLGNVLLLCFFVFFIFGIIGVQLWSGLLRQRCFINLPPNFTQPSYVPSYYRMPISDKEYLCSTAEHNGMHRCNDLPPLRSADLVTICQNTLPLDWTPPPAVYKTSTTTTMKNTNNSLPWPDIFEDRFIDGELVPHDLVPGDEASPFLVKQMSPLIAQSIAQPAFAPQEPLSMIQAVGSLQSSKSGHVSGRLTRRQTSSDPHEVNNLQFINNKAQTSQDDDEESPYDAMPMHLASETTTTTINKRLRRHSTTAATTGKTTKRDNSAKNGLVIETNSNSDQFNRDLNDCQKAADLATNSMNKNATNQRKCTNLSSQRKGLARNRLSSRKRGACINWNKYYTECKPAGPNPFQGTISFDNVGMAWTTIFLVISLEGWSDIMYLLQDSHSFWVWVYFVLLIVIGSFFMINLCLVVIATQFSATKKREMERMRQERLKFSSSSTLTGNANEPTNCYTVIVNLIAKFLRRTRLSVIRYFKAKKCSRLNAQCVDQRRKYINSHQKQEKRQFARGQQEHASIVRVSSHPASADLDEHAGCAMRSRLHTQAHNCSQVDQPTTSCSLEANCGSCEPPDTKNNQNTTKNNININVDIGNKNNNNINNNNDNYNRDGKQFCCSTSGRGSEKKKQNSQGIVADPISSNSGASLTSICSNAASRRHSWKQQSNRSRILRPNQVESRLTETQSSELNEPEEDNLLEDEHERVAQPEVASSRSLPLPAKTSSERHDDEQAIIERINNLPSSIYDAKTKSTVKSGACVLSLGLNNNNNNRDHDLNFNDDNHNNQRDQVDQQWIFDRVNMGDHDHDQIQSNEDQSNFNGRELMVSAANLATLNGVKKRANLNFNNNNNSLGKQKTTMICDNNEIATNSSRSKRRQRQLRNKRREQNDQLDEIEFNILPNFIVKNAKLRQFKSQFDMALKNLVDHCYFQRLILLAILINAISMGIEYHNQPIELTEAVEISNSVFACLFAIEMMLKLWAHGLYNYLIDGFNCFDGCIVILSMLELFESSGSGQSGLSVLRTFRLLRILKLVRFMPALQRQLVIMLRTLDNVAVFFALLVLFIFIFSILGMNLFGCKFCENLPDGTERCDRKNFNSLLWSLVTVFQILTQEDWNIVLFNGMEKTSHWAALYFVLLMTFGNYVLFNLLVAILVEGFSQEDDPKAVAVSSPSSSLLAANQNSLGPPNLPPKASAMTNYDDPPTLAYPIGKGYENNEHDDDEYSHQNEQVNDSRKAQQIRREQQANNDNNDLDNYDLDDLDVDVDMILYKSSSLDPEMPLNGRCNNAAILDNQTRPNPTIIGQNQRHQQQHSLQIASSSISNTVCSCCSPSKLTSKSRCNDDSGNGSLSREISRDSGGACCNNNTTASPVVGQQRTTISTTNNSNQKQQQLHNFMAETNETNTTNLTNATTSSILLRTEHIATLTSNQNKQQQQQQQQFVHHKRQAANFNVNVNDRSDKRACNLQLQVDIDANLQHKLSEQQQIIIAPFYNYGQSLTMRPIVGSKSVKECDAFGRGCKQVNEPIFYSDCANFGGQNHLQQITQSAAPLQQSAVSNAAATTPANFNASRQAPKRLVYFYDFLADDIEDEIEFLTRSLESKSYATSVHASSDPYLDQVARSTTIPICPFSRTSAGKIYERYRQQMLACYTKPLYLNNDFYQARQRDQSDSTSSPTRSSGAGQSWLNRDRNASHGSFFNGDSATNDNELMLNLPTNKQQKQLNQLEQDWTQIGQQSSLKSNRIGPFGKKSRADSTTTSDGSQPITQQRSLQDCENFLESYFANPMQNTDNKKNIYNNNSSYDNNSNRGANLYAGSTKSSSRQRKTFASSNSHFSHSDPSDGAKSAQNLLRSIGPFWSSQPDYLNETGVALMRLHECSRRNNMLLGQRERLLVQERGHFDRAACRCSNELYENALQMFTNYIRKQKESADNETKQQISARESSSNARRTSKRASLSMMMQQHGHKTLDVASETTCVNMSAIYGPFELKMPPATTSNDRNSNNRKQQADANVEINCKNSKSANNNSSRAAIKWQSLDSGSANAKLFASLNGCDLTLSREQFQRELMVSLHKFELAILAYKERRLRLRQERLVAAAAAASSRQQASNQLSSNPNQSLGRGHCNNRATALRRGSVILLSKLKLIGPDLQQQQQQLPSSSSKTSHQKRDSQAVALDQSRTFKHLHSVPRLSLTRADDSINLNDDSTITDDVVIKMASQNTNNEGSSGNNCKMDAKSELGARGSASMATSGGGGSDICESNQLSRSLVSCLPAGNWPCASPSSIVSSDAVNQQARKLSDCSQSQSVNINHWFNNNINLNEKRLSTTSNVIVTNSELRRRSSGSTKVASMHQISVVGFAQDEQQATNHQLQQLTDRQRNSSCFSQISGATLSVALSQDQENSISSMSRFSHGQSQYDRNFLLEVRSNWRRRRSFSGPFEWFWHETHLPGQDLMLDDIELNNNGSKSKRRAAKKRPKRIKAQRSNSSDYHSLNDRRVYRLDSRGFQTKLRGTFYVITHDPLLANNNHQSRQEAQAQLHHQNQLRQMHLAHNQSRLPMLTCSLDKEFEQQNQRQQLENYHTTTSNNGNNINFNGSRDNCASAISIGNTSLTQTTTTATTSASSAIVAANSMGQTCINGINTNYKPRTFFVYFRWTRWMLKRRHYSLFIFSPKSRIRRFCNLIIKRREFDYFVLFFISMNCVTLAMERPIIPQTSKEREFLIIANYYFTFLFTLEMALKVIAKGLYYGHGAYLSDNWNIMDGILVGFSLFDLLLSIVADRSPRIFAILRVFRLLRSLRPLRVINRLMGLKLVVQTLLLSLRPIGNIVLICCTFFIIFGILGVQLFKGTFFYCDGPDPLEIMRTVETREDCLMDHRNRWVNRKYNFDNLGQALMALFVLSSKDGWVNIMYTGLDAVGVDIQPRENYNEWRLLYFISFLLLVAFFVLNMFVGVVVENFHRCRKEQEMEEKARRAEKRQRKLDKRRRKLREPPYYSNYGKARAMLHRWVTGGYFDLLIAAIIGFNVIFMSLEHYQMAPELINLLKVSNYIFTVAFILEAIIKTTALGMRRYMKDRWNQLDVMIVAMSIVGIVFEELESFTFPINPTLLRVLRVMRIARVLKLLKMAKGIRALLDTVMQALPQVGNLGLLFFLLFFIFAALGVELFGRLECSDEYPCSGLMDQHAHFQNFGLAFLTLFRVATGDNWNGIMKDTLRDKCDASSNCVKNCCVSQIIAPLYFVVFVLLAQFVLVNVVVAVLMKHLEESHHEMEIDEEYELDKQLAEELAAKKRALLEARERQSLYWI